MQLAEERLSVERLARAEKQREYDAFVEAERRSRLVREGELQAEQLALEN